MQPQPAEETVRSVIDIAKLSLTFETNDGPVHALSDIDLAIGEGEFVSFIGPSGCGKTTFLRCIAALETPTGGELTVNGMTPIRTLMQTTQLPMEWMLEWVLNATVSCKYTAMVPTICCIATPTTIGRARSSSALIMAMMDW